MLMFGPGAGFRSPKMPASHENGFALKEGENSPIKHVIAMFVKLPLLSVRLGRLRTTESGVRIAIETAERWVFYLPVATMVKIDVGFVDDAEAMDALPAFRVRIRCLQLRSQGRKEEGFGREEGRGGERRQGIAAWLRRRLGGKLNLFLMSGVGGWSAPRGLVFGVGHLYIFRGLRCLDRGPYDSFRLDRPVHYDHGGGASDEEKEEHHRT
eukprot:1211891-Rhodomonas_salina.3